jgi:predicted transcriptional regulator
MMSKTAKKIRKLMIDHETSGAEIARGLGISRVAVWQVIHGERRNPRIRKAIEDTVHQKIWRDNGRRVGTDQF